MIFPNWILLPWCWLKKKIEDSLVRLCELMGREGRFLDKRKDHVEIIEF